MFLRSYYLLFSLVALLVIAACGDDEKSPSEPGGTLDPSTEGACCDEATEQCVVTDQETCESGGGVYEGDDTVCDPNPCPPPVDPEGACCFADGSCVVSTEAGCEGSYEGDDTVCDPNPCPLPGPTPVVDFSELDVNLTSPRSGEAVSPRDYLGKLSAWYFGHAT